MLLQMFPIIPVFMLQCTMTLILLLLVLLMIMSFYVLFLL